MTEKQIETRAESLMSEYYGDSRATAISRLAGAILLAALLLSRNRSAASSPTNSTKE